MKHRRTYTYFRTSNSMGFKPTLVGIRYACLWEQTKVLKDTLHLSKMVDSFTVRRQLRRYINDPLYIGILVNGKY